MTKLAWDKSGERFFQAGVDHGVLYPPTGPGVAWNGLISIEEKRSNAATDSYYIDGIKYYDSVEGEDYEATLNAFTYPDEFEVCDGSLDIAPGFSVTRQFRQTFGLCYRTKIGNDLDPDLGYKLHIVYNVTAAPSDRSNTSMSDKADPMSLSWDLNAVPVDSTMHKPTAHYVIDSTKVDQAALAAVEAILYGTDNADPALPDPAALSLNFAVDAGLVVPTEYWLIDGGTPASAGPGSLDGGLMTN